MLKTRIRQVCIQLLDEKISSIEAGIERAQRDANRQTKSSAGDKHETGRAMMHLEQERKASQLSGVLQDHNRLTTLDMAPADHVRPGSLVQTSMGAFFVSIGAGEIEVDGNTVICISLESPLGQELEDCEAGDVVYFRDKAIEVEWVQ